MNALTAFHIAALVSGFAAFMIAAIWRVAGTNQGERIKAVCIGAAGMGLVLAALFIFLAEVIKG